VQTTANTFCAHRLPPPAFLLEAVSAFGLAKEDPANPATLYPARSTIRPPRRRMFPWHIAEPQNPTGRNDVSLLGCCSRRRLASLLAILSYKHLGYLLPTEAPPYMVSIPMHLSVPILCVKTKIKEFQKKARVPTG
jgi:hypothetical protein